MIMRRVETFSRRRKKKDDVDLMHEKYDEEDE